MIVPPVPPLSRFHFDRINRMERIFLAATALVASLDHYGRIGTFCHRRQRRGDKMSTAGGGSPTLIPNRLTTNFPAGKILKKLREEK